MTEHRERQWNGSAAGSPPSGSRVVERDDEQILFRTKRYNGDELRIILGSYEGKPTLQARDWFEVDGQWRPSKKGISLPVRELGAIVAALNKALEQVSRDGHRVSHGEEDPL